MENKNFAFGGITRSIGGAVCADGDLHTAVDVCNDGVGLQLLEKPRELFELASGETLLCVHEPEGEEKHYITQWEVPSEDAQGSGGGDNAQSPTEVVTPVTDDPVIDDEPYVEPVTPSEIDPSDDDEPYVEPQPYEPPQTADSTTTGYYEDCEEAEAVADNGGSTETTTPEGHIYMCWWVKENNQYTRKQMLDITPYGKITAIQPMGNTLICNHAGGEDFPKEIRYYLWKGEDEEYIGLGSKPPMIDITFGLESTFEYYPKTKSTFDGTTKYKRYGGISITSYPYTDTVGVWFSEWKGTSYVPPYAMYKDGTYTFPQDFDSTTDSDIFSHWSSTYSIEGVTSPDGKTDVAGMKNNWTTMALGAYNKFIYDQNKENKFVFPFYVRYAYQLYDGSLIMHSYPVLMIPNSRGPVFALDGMKGLRADLDDKDETYEKVRIEFQGRVYGFSSKLMYDLKKLAAENLARLKNWKDLIRGLNIYVTPPIYNYKQGGQVLGWKCMDWRDPSNNIATEGVTPWDKYYTIGKVKYKDESRVPAVDAEKGGIVGLGDMFVSLTAGGSAEIFWPYSYDAGGGEDPIYFPYPDYILDIPQKEDDEVRELHENAGQFYKLAEIPYEKLVAMAETAQGEKDVPAKKHILQTISNQDVMQDDNCSHDTMSSNILYGYNRRLNMANVSKVMHSPLKPSVLWCKDGAFEEVMGVDTEVTYPYQVTIYAHNGTEIARLKSTDSAVNNGCPQYLFYPNNEAFEALIIRGTTKYRVPMREHKALNGAFWCADFLNDSIDLWKNYSLTGTATNADLTLPEVNKVVDDSNKIYTSETDNPFYVPFGNINIAGGGEVRALCAATQAMSQGQFGQHPMYCFTTEGVWAMTVSNTGGWGTIQPVTRDVITERTMPLSLDSTVVFLGDRGLMQLAGAEANPLSGAVRSYDYITLSKLADLATPTGTTDLLTAAALLTTFPDVAVLTYDAKSARIYVTPENVSASWVYNLKSGLWTQATTHIDRQVTTYPECEGQQGNKVVEIGSTIGYQKDKGLVITRPIKFGDASVLKKWRELAVRGHFKPYGSVIQCALWGTRNWINYALVASSTKNRLTRWGGSPYFGHAVGVFITRPNDYLLHVVGADAVIEVEEINKTR